MRIFLLLIVAAALPALTALAEQPAGRKPEKAATSGKLLPLRGAASAHSCAAYGAGFVRVEGSDTCVKIGGAVSIGAGASTGAR
jgi:hypothetical protein